MSDEQRNKTLDQLGDQRWKDFEKGSPLLPPGFPSEPADSIPEGLKEKNMPHVSVKLWPGRSEQTKQRLGDAIVEDVFMLYKDFYADDEMHRLGINLTGIEEITGMSGKALIEKNEPNASETKTARQISVKANGKTTVFELNDSPAARDLYVQLPLGISVENYSNNEKIFYPPEKLNTNDTPQADAQAGTLAYYAPWGDVVMIYGRFGSAAGLYELGHAISGSEHIRMISGTIQIEKVSAP